MSSFFETRHLTVGYHKIPLIKDIDIELEKGSILTLIGPNGSGKSTILKSITKHLESLAGTVYIDQKSTDSMTGGDLSRQVSVVLTERLKTDLMTCEDVVATGRYPYTGLLGILSAEDKGKVKAAMVMVNAWDLRDRDFTEISDGQRQRILLARAICQDPQIIVLDEPTSFLDVRYKLELLEILRRLSKEEGITVIMSLHELELAQKVSDFVMCVKGDRISHYGKPEAIFQRNLIQDLYEVSNGAYNPTFGSFEMAKPSGEAKVFVIAGGGRGIMTYRSLQKKRIPFMTGILHDNDIDYQLAYDLASDIIGVKAFQAIDEATYQTALDKMKTCDVVINCLSDYGHSNALNKDLYEQALKAGLKVVTSAEDLWRQRSTYKVKQD